MDSIRTRRHDLCFGCGSHAYDREENYCLRCGYSESSPIWGALLMVGICLAVLALLGWLMS